MGHELLAPDAGDMETFFYDCQVDVDDDGEVHVLASYMRGGQKGIVHIAKSSDNLPVMGELPPCDPGSRVRFALRGNSLCATWHELIQVGDNPPKCENHVFFSRAQFDGGPAQWSAKVLVTNLGGGADNKEPDVAFDLEGNLHFAWETVR